MTALHDDYNAQATVQGLAALLELSRAARESSSTRELGFLLANDTLRLLPYRQAALWLASEGVHTLSGVVLPEANAPYVLWLESVCRHLAGEGAPVSVPPAGDEPAPAPTAAPLRAFTAADLPPALAASWTEWWPAHALWVALPGGNGTAVQGGLLLARDEAFASAELPLLHEWTGSWWHAFHALQGHRPSGLRSGWARLRAHFSLNPQRRWWQQARVRWALAVLAVLALPVRLTVLAPGELVPAHPLVVRAPLDGVIDAFHVQPNQVVKKDQPLFGFDEALIDSKREVAEQALATAEAEYRQASQQALLDLKARAQLASITGRIEEKRAEVEFLRDQLQRARVLAPGDGVVLFDDPSEWIGKPVSVGERILRIAAPGDAEVEAWLPLADALALESGAGATLYLNASPLSPVSARLRYMAHDAVQRPDGSYAYRVRATLAEGTEHRVGLKGTAKLEGGWVPLAYWMLRRPLASVRATLGV